MKGLFPRPLHPLAAALVASAAFLSPSGSASVAWGQDAPPVGEGVITSGALPTDRPIRPREAAPLSEAEARAAAEPIADQVAPAAEADAAAAPAAPDGPARDAPAESAPPSDGALPPGLATADGAEVEASFLQRSRLILAKLLNNDRSVGPFGMPMDPANVKEIPLAEQYQEEEVAPQVNTSALRSALLSLPITGVYPQKGVLVLGARTFSVGGQFGMKVQDLTIRLRFEGIQNGELVFRDVETQEVTSIPFNPLPAEFEPLDKGAKKKAPGSGIIPMDDLFIAN